MVKDMFGEDVILIVFWFDFGFDDLCWSYSRIFKSFSVDSLEVGVSKGWEGPWRR